jgi:hypothetical protein
VEESDLIFAASGSEELLVTKEDVVGMAAAGEKVSSQKLWRTRFDGGSLPCL